MTWQPIETVPKDGNDILVWGKSLGYLVVYFYKGDNPDFPWRTLDGSSYCANAFLYWMPLPEPPAQ